MKIIDNTGTWAEQKLLTKFHVNYRISREDWDFLCRVFDEPLQGEFPHQPFGINAHHCRRTARRPKVYVVPDPAVPFADAVIVAVKWASPQEGGNAITWISQVANNSTFDHVADVAAFQAATHDTGGSSGALLTIEDIEARSGLILYMPTGGTGHQRVSVLIFSAWMKGKFQAYYKSANWFGRGINDADQADWRANAKLCKRRYQSASITKWE